MRLGRQGGEGGVEQDSRGRVSRCTGPNAEDTVQKEIADWSECSRGWGRWRSRERGFHAIKKEKIFCVRKREPATNKMNKMYYFLF